MTSELIEQLENALHISEGNDFKIRADFVREIIAALREPEGQAVAVPADESLWMIEQTSTGGGMRSFWNGAGFGWDAMKGARYSSRRIAEEVARNGPNCTVSVVHGVPEVCEHLFRCGINPDSPPASKPEAQAVAVMHHESTGWVQWLENPRTIPDRAALYVSSPAPSGYVMVPREPTGAMIQAGERFDAEWRRKSIGVFGGATVGDIYRAMLAAAEEGK